MKLVEIEDSLGDDLSVANAARASYATASTRLTTGDIKLIKFLAKHDHTSPFRHTAIRFHLRTTLRERILWESPGAADMFYGAGMQFVPSLSELIKDHGMDDWVDWRWTASAQAIVTWFNTFRGWQLLGDYGQLILDAARSRMPVAIGALLGMRDLTPIDIEPLDYGHVGVLNDGYVRLVDAMHAGTDEEAMVTFEVRAPFMVRSQWFKYVRNSAHDPAIVFDLIEGAESGNGDDCDWGDPMYARNEMSRRYVRDRMSFYIPEEFAWRSAPENSKQGSGGPVDATLGNSLSASLAVSIHESMTRYERALESGVAPEQARLMLPAYAMFTNWYWTASLNSVKFFLAQRLGHDAQYEIQAYARAVKQLLEEAGFHV